LLAAGACLDILPPIHHCGTRTTRTHCWRACQVLPTLHGNQAGHVTSCQRGLIRCGWRYGAGGRHTTSQAMCLYFRPLAAYAVSCCGFHAASPPLCAHLTPLPSPLHSMPLPPLLRLLPPHHIDTLHHRGQFGARSFCILWAASRGSERCSAGWQGQEKGRAWRAVAWAETCLLYFLIYVAMCYGTAGR